VRAATFFAKQQSACEQATALRTAQAEFNIATKDYTSMNIAEHIAKLEATIADKQKAVRTIMELSASENRSTDEAESAEVDTLNKEIGALEGDVARWKKMYAVEAAAAKPVQQQNPPGHASGSNVSVLQLKKVPVKLEPGIAFARYARCKGLAYIDHEPARVIAKNLYPDDERLHALLTPKAAVPAANTIDDAWAGYLVTEGGPFADFVEWLRPQTILGKFGAGGVPGLRRVPFNVPLVTQASAGSGYWVGEGKAKPLTSWSYSRTTLTPLKVANIAVTTMELLRDSRMAADALIRDELAAALRERLDIDFIDPGKAAVSNVSPASITNAATPIPSAGSDAEDVRADIRTLFGAFIAANNPPSSGVWIMSATTALALSLMQNPLGQTEFPGIGMSGGMLFGLPVIVSEYAVIDTEGALVILANASDIYLGDEGGVDVSVSTEASLEMDNAPTNASAPSGAVAETTMVSLWQTNSVGFRAERAINWALRRTDSVQYIEGVTWGEAS
jgi:hypothetical protein